MKKEHFQKGWGWLVEEFLKKPFRMAVVAIVSGILITGGNFVVKKTGIWLGKVINMNQRIVQVEADLSKSSYNDSILEVKINKQSEVLSAVRDELLEFRGALRSQGIYSISRRPRSGGERSLDDLIGDLKSLDSNQVNGADVETTSTFRRPR